MAKYCVVVDAGHGGSDPGKVGINQALEKDVNLQIAEKLKAFLEAEDIRVVMTRETDTGLYDEDSQNKKAQDRRYIIHFHLQSVLFHRFCLKLCTKIREV